MLINIFLFPLRVALAGIIGKAKRAFKEFDARRSLRLIVADQPGTGTVKGIK